MEKTLNKKRIFLSPPHMGGLELEFVNEAFSSNYIAPLGPMVDAFEKEFSEYIGIKNCLALSSGTAAMHLALRHLGIGQGDEVFASTLTFLGSVSPIIFEGATPVFIDSERSSWNMDPVLLEKELDSCAKKGRLPKAVIPTDLYGQCADYEKIFFSVCNKYDIPLIVDAAEALGARYQRSEVRGQGSEESDAWNHAGVGAKAAIYSFNGNKIITTSGGGMLASDDKELIDHARKLSQQARENFVHYEHEEIGYNYRMSNILAAIGRGQLKVLDERVEKKRWIFEYYRNAIEDIPGIEFMPEPPYSRSNRWLTVILINPEEFGCDNKTVRLALEKENIESRPVWKPMHMQPVFNGLRRKAQGEGHQVNRDKKTYHARVVGGEVAEDLFNRGLCLPSGTAMNEEDLERVVKVIRDSRG
jgi:dTDP-4-amino-4,6-dideoxygalactose transaminase